MNPKSNLNEICQKFKVPFPEYETDPQGNLWVSSCVIFDGTEFTSSPCDTKKAAEMDVAAQAVAYLQTRPPPTGEELARLQKIFEERKFLQHQKRELKEFEKNPISRLNELYQRKGTVAPDFVYLQAPGANHRYICELTLIYHGNKKFRSSPHASKATAKHEVAAMAVEYVQEEERKNMAKQNMSELIEVPREGPQPLGAISELNEYCQKLGLVSPVYDFEYSQTGMWKCSVVLFDGTRFESSYHHDKKSGKYEVAEIALEHVNSLGTFGYKPPPPVPPNYLPPLNSTSTPTSSAKLHPASVAKGKGAAKGVAEPLPPRPVTPSYSNPIGALVDLCQKNGRRIPVYEFEYSQQTSSWQCICKIYDGTVFRSG